MLLLGLHTGSSRQWLRGVHRDISILSLLSGICYKSDMEGLGGAGKGASPNKGGAGSTAGISHSKSK